MKKILFFFLFSFFAFSQNNNANGIDFDMPAEVSNAFNQQFPNAKKVNWNRVYRSLDNSSQERFEVTFKMNKSNYLVSYIKDGTVKAIEKSLKPSQLPDQILSYLQTNYPTFKIQEASEVALENGDTNIEIGLQDDAGFSVAVFDKNNDFLFIKQSED